MKNIKPFRNHQNGYTLVELVVVLVILGVLGAIGGSRFFSFDSYQSRGFFENVSSAMRYAHKYAVAKGCYVQVTVQSNAYTLYERDGCLTGSFTNKVPTAGGVNVGFMEETAPSGIILNVSSGPTTFRFDPLGRVFDTSDAIVNVEISVSGTIPRTLSIAGQTGYVYCSSC